MGHVIQRRTLTGLMTAGLGVTLLDALKAGPAVGAPTSDQIELVRKANAVLDEARHDRQFGNAADLFRRARAVMVVPNLVKGGFFVGGEVGNAVLMASHGATWSPPAFY